MQDSVARPASSWFFLGVGETNFSQGKISVNSTLSFGGLIKVRVRTRGSNAGLQSARISRHSQGAVDLSDHTCLNAPSQPYAV